MDLYMTGKLKLDQLISRTVTLDEINTAFDLIQGEGAAHQLVQFELACRVPVHQHRTTR